MRKTGWLIDIERQQETNITNHTQANGVRLPPRAYVHSFFYLQWAVGVENNVEEFPDLADESIRLPVL